MAFYGSLSLVIDGSLRFTTVFPILFVSMSMRPSDVRQCSLWFSGVLPGSLGFSVVSVSLRCCKVRQGTLRFAKFRQGSPRFENGR